MPKMCMVTMCHVIVMSSIATLPTITYYIGGSPTKRGKYLIILCTFLMDV